MKRALLAWEFGAGRTHVVNLLGVAAHLCGTGASCAAALYETRFAGEFAAIGIPVVQNYVWPSRRRAQPDWTERQARGFGDVLANLGFASPSTLGAALAHYDGLFALFKPDIVLCENAPGAMLAARGRIPAIAFGTAACLPPIEGNGFARYHGAGGPPSWPEDFVCTQINEALVAAGRPPLAKLADLLNIEGVYPFGPEEFDIYAGKRSAPMLPAYAPGFELPDNPGTGHEIFVYLQPFVQRSAAIMAGLREIGRPTRLYIPDLSPDERAKFPPSCRIEANAVPLARILEDSRGVVHHGGPQLASMCLAAGLPQIILPKERDNEAAGRFAQSQGMGVARHVTEVTAEWLSAHARRAFDDAEWTRHCLAKAPEFRDWFKSDPTAMVAEAARALLNRAE